MWDFNKIWQVDFVNKVTRFNRVNSGLNEKEGTLFEPRNRSYPSL